MKFEYNSTRFHGKKDLPQGILDDIKDFIYLSLGGESVATLTKGRLQDLLLNYEYEGNHLLINQLEPVFIYISRTGDLW